MAKSFQETPKCKNCKTNSQKIIKHNYDCFGNYLSTRFSVFCSTDCRKRRITGDTVLFAKKTLPEVLQKFTELNLSKFKPRSFVYILLKKQEVVYFGSTTNISERIRVHLKEKTKDFDRAMYFETDTYESVEMFLIKTFPTKYNHCTTAKKAHDPNF